MDADRSLYRLGVSGELPLGNRWTLRPEAEIARFEEETEAYVDSQGVGIPGISVKIGRLSFGPVFEQRFDTDARNAVAPRIGIEALWDFDDAQMIDIADGFGPVNDSFHARIVGGLDVKLGRAIIGTEGFYDGIGAEGYDAYGLTVSLRFDM